MSKWGHWFWRTKVGLLSLVFFIGKKSESIHMGICTSGFCFLISRVRPPNNYARCFMAKVEVKILIYNIIFENVKKKVEYFL